MYIIRNRAEITKIKLYFLFKPDPDPLKKNAGLEHWLTDPDQNEGYVVWSETNAQGQINYIPIILKTPSFKDFLGLVPADSDGLFAAVHLPRIGGSEIVFGIGGRLTS